MQKLAELDHVSETLRESVPQNIREAIDLYVEHGVRTGSFTYAVLCNDLHGAVVRADVNSLAAIKPICQYVYNAVPSSLWGSKQAVEDHIRAGINADVTTLD